MSSVRIMWDVQREMSRAQTISVIGPLFVSPVKAMVSVAQIVGGLAMTILLGSAAVITRDYWFVLKSVESMAHVAEGAFGFSYAMINLCTFGVAGALTEFPTASA